MAAPLPAPSHSNTALVVQVICGAVVSCTVTVRWQVLWLPQASVAVKVTVAVPLAPQPSLRAVKSFVTTALPQVSVALAKASHAAICAALPVQSHSNTALVGQVISGKVVSCTVRMFVQRLWLPQASVAVQMTVALPLAPQPSLKPA